MTSLIRRMLNREEITEPDTNEEVSNDNNQSNTRIKGKIFKIHQKGYGFISSRDVPFTRIFFHWSALLPDTLNFKELKEGMEVEFIPITTPGKGTRAIKIRVLQ